MDGENNGKPYYSKMDDLGVPLFLETPIYSRDAPSTQRFLACCLKACATQLANPTCAWGKKKTLRGFVWKMSNRRPKVSPKWGCNKSKATHFDIARQNRNNPLVVRWSLVFFELLLRAMVAESRLQTVTNGKDGTCEELRKPKFNWYSWQLFLKFDYIMSSDSDYIIPIDWQLLISDIYSLRNC